MMSFAVLARCPDYPVLQVSNFLDEEAISLVVLCHFAKLLSGLLRLVILPFPLDFKIW